MDCVKGGEIVIDINNESKTSKEVVVPPSLCEGEVSISVEEVVSSDKLGNFTGNQKKGDEISDKNSKREKRKSSGKKPPKPPRPSSGLWLDPADQKLIKEITELAMMKRARMVRVKKMKAAKTLPNTTNSSSSGSLLAMVFTVIFCIVIILQGCHSSGYSHVNKATLPRLGSLESSSLNGGVPITSIGSPNGMELVFESGNNGHYSKMQTE